MRSHPTRHVVVLGLALSLLAGCGARWEGDEQATSARAATELDATASETDVAAAAADDQATAGGAAVASGPGTSIVRGQVGAGGGGGASGPAARGLTATTITVGIMASENINSAAAAFGATGLAFPDPKTQVEPLVKWINGHGGIAGRQLQIVWHFRDDLSGDTGAAKMQAACNDFVQDKQVFLVTTVYSGHEMAPCLAAAGIPFVESGAGPPHYGIPTYDSLRGYYVTPNQLSVDRYATSLVERLASQGFFANGAKVGLIYMGYPYSAAAVERSLKPALKRHGVTLTDEQKLRELQRASDFAGTQAEVSNAVLRFKSKGITRVIGLEDQATTFMSAAEQQSYYPRYGLGTNSLVGAAQSNPKSMKDTTIVGFSYPQDVLSADQGGPTGEPEKVCRQLYVESGQDPADELAWGIQRTHCEGLFFLKAVLDRIKAGVTVRAFISAIESLGESYSTMTNYGVRFAPGRYDGVAKLRPLVFVEGCGCLRFSGPAYAIP